MTAPHRKKTIQKLIKYAAQPGGITVADIMRTRICTMAKAVGYLRAAEATGKVVRSGGEPGSAFRWSATAPPPTLIQAGGGRRRAA